MEQGKKCFEYGENKNDGKLKSEGGGEDAFASCLC